MAIDSGLICVAITFIWLTQRIPDLPHYDTQISEKCARSGAGAIHKRSPKDSNIQVNVSPNACATIIIDQPVLLTCHFDIQVTCAWTRRGFHVDIKQRYKYIQQDNGTNTLDCSITIEQFKAIDAGQWLCKSMATSSEPANMGAAICLLHEVRITKHPDALIIVKIGQEVRIECEFDSEVICSWLHNTIDVKINDAYRFNEAETKDCSLTIQQFQEKDIGTWQCQNKGNETELNVTSTEAMVSQMEAPSKPQIFESLPGSNEEYHIICISQNGKPPPKLHWEVDGSKLPSSDIKAKPSDHNNHVLISITCAQINKLNGSLSLECVIEHELDNSRNEINIGNLSCVKDKGCPSDYCESGMSGGFIASIVINVLLLGVVLAASIAYTFINKKNHRKKDPRKSSEDDPQCDIPLQHSSS